MTSGGYGVDACESLGESQVDELIEPGLAFVLLRHLSVVIRHLWLCRPHSNEGKAWLGIDLSGCLLFTQRNTIRPLLTIDILLTNTHT